jgi:PTS system fructose-specific IIC component
VPELITAQLVALDAQFGDSKDDVIKALARLVAAAGRSADADGLADDAFAREAKSSTGMPGGLAIPHCRSEHVTEPTLVFARLSPGVDFGSKDGPADLTFMIAAPATGDQEHMRLLTKLARALVRKDFTDALRSATTNEEIVELVSGVVADQPAAKAEPQAVTTTAAGNGGAPAPAPADTSGSSGSTAAAGAPAAVPAASSTAPSSTPDRGDMTIVAVTACPTGIAHTYMAAEALEAAGKKAGVNVVVEPQGSVGAETIDPSIIASASAAIFATDVGVRNRERFAGLPEISTGVKNGIHEADELVARAIAAASDPSAARVSGTASAPAGGGGRPQLAGGIGTKLRTALLTGVSYMIPFVAAGGLLIALGFLFGGYQVDPNIATTNSLNNLPGGPLVDGAMFNSAFFLYLGAVFIFLGKAAFALFVAALGGYIAYAIADRPGIAPGFIVGLICTGSVTDGIPGIGAGFIGAIIGGLLAGYIALRIASLRVPRWLAGLMPVVIIPLVTTLIAGGLMVVVLGRPLAWLTEKLQDGLSNMNSGSAVLLGVILGLMMCFDLGGPVNKAAYVFAITQLGDSATTANFRIMAAVMLAGMVPPLALALATTLRPALFTEPELENGRAAWLLGASFISEGAIPFAAADPLRIIPPAMLGGAVTGALSELLHVGLHAPHGGIFVLFAVDNKIGFVIALAAGTVVTALGVIALKTMRGEDVAAETVDGRLVNA